MRKRLTQLTASASASLLDINPFKRFKFQSYPLTYIANPLGFACRIAVSDILETQWQYIDAHKGASMSFQAFNLTLTARLMVVSHIKTFQFLIIALQSAYSAENAEFLSQTVFWPILSPHGSKTMLLMDHLWAFPAFTWSLTAGIMGISHLRIC